MSEIRQKLSKSCWLEKPQISCKRWSAVDKGNPSSDNVCEVEPGTYIDKPELTLELKSTNRTILTLVIKNQRHMDFLPILIHKQLPRLREYIITNTPIRRISKKNFEKLQLLQKLTLDRNRITTIKNNTFEDLISVSYIIISIFFYFF